MKIQKIRNIVNKYRDALTETDTVKRFLSKPCLNPFINPVGISKTYFSAHNIDDVNLISDKNYGRALY